MNCWQVKLNFHTPLHIGVDGIGQENVDQTFHSDALFGAIVSIWAQVYPEDLQKEFFTNPSFSVSSCFPWFEHKKQSIEFYPIPIGAFDKVLSELDEDNSKTRKALKKKRFFSKRLFEIYLQEGKDGFSKQIKHNLNYVKTGGAYLLQPEDFTMFYQDSKEPESSKLQDQVKTKEVPRISVSRSGSQDTQIWYFAKQYYQSGGLFFLLQCDDPKIKKKLTTIINILGDTGIGADRSTGHGFFTPTYEKKYSLKEAKGKSLHLQLSLLLPNQSDIQAICDGTHKSYDLITRKGAVTLPGKMNLRKNPVQMFQIGSSFSSPLEGQCAEVLQLHQNEPEKKMSIYRYGKAFNIRMKA
ncbi:MAG: CRISPR-associated protein Csm4 [bacterium]|jgi:CRISPR-associated protein Csm4